LISTAWTGRVVCSSRRLPHTGSVSVDRNETICLTEYDEAICDAKMQGKSYHSAELLQSRDRNIAICNLVRFQVLMAASITIELISTIASIIIMVKMEASLKCLL
jgi:hypothetical protein